MPLIFIPRRQIIELLYQGRKTPKHNIMTRYIDAHCHLQNNTSQNVTDVISSAVAQNIVGFVCNATNPDDWDSVLNLGKMCASVYGCIGIHPWHIDNLTPNWHTRMIEILAQHPELMIGEIGLDNSRPNIDAQQKVFMAQMDIAHIMGRVVHIHCVHAIDKMLHIFRHRHGMMPPAIVMHSFSGPANVIDRLINEYNAYFSYSPMIHDSRRRGMRAALCATPNNRILAESDCENPLRVLDVVNTISEVKSTDVAQMADIIYSNTHQALKNGPTEPNTFIIGK